MAPLRVKEILNKTVNYFEQHGIDRARLDAEVLLAYVLDRERVDLYVEFNRPLTTEEVDKYRELVIKRRKGIPVAYLVGHKEFMSLEFKVTPEVLIPRPETEHVVEIGLKLIEAWEQPEITVVDVGTGSGAIIVSLVKLAEAELKGIGVDISESALEVAQENAAYHGVESEIDFKAGDLLAPVKREADLIVSNPPYVPSKKLESIQEEVKQQPKLALDGGQDGLNYYRQLITQSRDVLKPGGQIILEIGIKQAEAVTQLLQQVGFSKIEVTTDYAGIERVVSATK